jgi:hypothetical protein
MTTINDGSSEAVVRTFDPRQSTGGQSALVNGPYYGIQVLNGVGRETYLAPNGTDEKSEWVQLYVGLVIPMYLKAFNIRFGTKSADSSSFAESYSRPLQLRCWKKPRPLLPDWRIGDGVNDASGSYGSQPTREWMQLRRDFAGAVVAGGAELVIGTLDMTDDGGVGNFGEYNGVNLAPFDYFGFWVSGSGAFDVAMAVGHSGISYLDNEVRIFAGGSLGANYGGLYGLQAVDLVIPCPGAQLRLRNTTAGALTYYYSTIAYNRRT